MEITTREELLNGLYYVHDRLSVLAKLMERYVQMERAYRAKLAYTGLQDHTAEIQTKSVTSKGKLLLIALGSTVAVFYALLSLLSGMGLGSALVFAVPILILIFAKEQKKLRLAALVFLVAMVAWFTYVLVQYAPPAATIILGVLMAVVLAGETAVILFYNGRYVVRKNQQADAHNAKVIRATDAKNAEIAQSNALVSQKRAELMNRYDQVCGELKQNTGSWFPPDYYSLEAVEHFIKAVENHKADTVKEMILEYDQSMDRQQMLESQRQTNLKLDKIASNQEVNNELLKEQNKLIRQGNAIQMMKMFQDQFNHNDSMNEQRRTRAAINNNTQATRDFHKEVKDIFHRW